MDSRNNQSEADCTERTEKKLVEEVKIDEKDIQIIMDQANVTYEIAKKTLIKNNFDIVNAIMELTFN
ncbi:nascent polypeptide associated complex alpha subunit-related [Anaeramoeba flamelloides]|uniref:Nascent polypeptide associated complex alpha subunit-related n=1 Tax=Anaeramoeba flamelloides TaxID=1746091 RepID=A0ABQ8YXA1_9EUKA|nr:nascent polypeptide associated complex alpha subunit-related [Anaeramoeba flamelloides]